MYSTSLGNGQSSFQTPLVFFFQMYAWNNDCNGKRHCSVSIMWCGVVWCGVVWCGVVWCGVVWCGVVWCGVVWCGVVWYGMAWYGVRFNYLKVNQEAIQFAFQTSTVKVLSTGIKQNADQTNTE